MNAYRIELGNGNGESADERDDSLEGQSLIDGSLCSQIKVAKHDQHVHCKDKHGIKGQIEALPNLRSLLQLTFGFFCTFFSFTVQQNLMSVVLEEAGASGQIAFASLALLYAVFMPACIIVPLVLRSVNPRRILPIGTLCYALYALAASGPAIASHSSSLFKLLAQIALLFSAVLIGASAAVVWICQGHIITHISPQHLLNRYVSFFYTIFNFSAVVGALAADRVLSVFGSVAFFPFLFAVSAVGTSLICCIGPPVQHDDIIPEPILLPLPSCEELLPMLHEPCAFLRKDTRAARIFCLGLGFGFSMNSFTSAGLPKLILARSGAAHHVAHAFVGVGLGRFLASAGYGFVADCIGRRAALMLGLLSLGCTVGFLLLEGNPAFGYPQIAGLSVPYGYVGSFFQGFTNSTVNCSLTALISAGFHGGDAKLALSLMYLSSSGMSVLGFAVFPLMPRNLALACVAIFSACCIILTSMHKPLFHAEHAISSNSTPGDASKPAPLTIGAVKSSEHAVPGMATG